MPYFKLHRTHALRTTKGHTIQFVKGESVWVPPICVPDAVAIGAISDVDVDVIDDEPKPVVQMTPDERKAKIIAAFETLIERNARGDFSASGAPNTRKLEELCGFEVPNRERDAVWMAYTNEQAEEQ